MSYELVITSFWEYLVMVYLKHGTLGSNVDNYSGFFVLEFRV